MLETPPAAVKKVLIVGSPRSGTTWLSYVLAHHPRVVALQHSALMPYLLSTDLWRDQRLATKVTATIDGEAIATPVSEALPAERLHARIGAFTDAVLGEMAAIKPGANVVVDKQPENGRIAERLHRVMPDAYFLHVVRDPRAVLASQRAASNGWAERQFPTRPVDGADLWVSDVEAARRVGTYSDRFLEVRYEDLMTNGEALLATIHEFIGLEATSDDRRSALDANAKDSMRASGSLPADFVRTAGIEGWQRDLSSRDVATIERITGVLMDDLGYERVSSSRLPSVRIPLHRFAKKVATVAERVGFSIRYRTHMRLVGRQPEWIATLDP